jgi:hypothetical protein
MQQRLKSAPGAAWARVVAAELLDELFVTAYYSLPALDARFGWEAFATLASDLESTRPRGGFFVYARYTSDNSPAWARILTARMREDQQAASECR